MVGGIPFEEENDMSLCKNSYTKDGVRHETGRWYVCFKDHNEIWHRLSADKNRSVSEAMDRNITKLVRYKLAGDLPDAALLKWTEGIPYRLKSKLAEIGLLDAERISSLRPLLDHISGTPECPGWRQYLTAKGGSPKHVRIFITRATTVIRGCGFAYWGDISATKVLDYIHTLRSARTSRKGNKIQGISAQTFNFYLSAFKSFCRWMIREGRARQNPVEHLQGLNVRVDRRHDRRALSVEELRWLLHVTCNGPERCGMSGRERAFIYRLAVETGLRASELASLTVGSFDLEADHPTVTVEAAYSKHRREDNLLLRAETAEELRVLIKGMASQGKVFHMPTNVPMAKPLEKDLADARSAWIKAGKDQEEKRQRRESSFLLYEDDRHRFADFHSLRHTAGSLLAANQVSPKVAQALMRHSDINLTMTRYTHVYRGQEAEAISRLPDLRQPPMLPAPVANEPSNADKDSKEKA